MINGPVDRSGAAEAAVWDALRTVIAPELRGSLVDRGMSRVAAPSKRAVTALARPVRTPNDDERRGDKPEPLAPPQRSAT